MKKIVFICNSDDIFSVRFVKYILKPNNFDIYILTPFSTKYCEYYKQNGVKIIQTRIKTDNWFYNRFTGFFVIVSILKNIYSIKPDIIHVFYVYKYILKIIKYFKKPNKVILHFLGSDLLRLDNKDVELLKKEIKYSDKIVLGSESLYNKASNLKILSDKCKFIRFGIDFDDIEKKIDSKNDIRNKFLGKNNINKIVITIGYNAGRPQQHLKVLNSINNLDNNIKNKILLILPLTYQRNDQTYINSIKSLLSCIGVDYIVLENFMNNEEIADLYISTNIFINSQVTDALSSSMLEHLYSGSIVLNGSWLDYKYLDDNHLYYKTFNDFDELRNIISDLILNYNKFSNNNIEYNRSFLKNDISWNVALKKWKELYNSLLNNNFDGDFYG